ncbi:MAG: hypothetical protein M1833_005677 [Piccolia ochrophora]|nr:MAG: hypothetical protein M1833_005677 [Piccolia ochrophora]
MFGMLVWALCAAHGAGELVNQGSTTRGSTLSWAAVYGLQSFVGGWGTGCIGQSDWTRYARTPNAALFGQAVTAPLTLCITALCGLLITSATSQIYGEYYWNPLQLLIQIQQHSMSPGARAGTFFAGLGFLAEQMALCIVLNSMASGMDLAALSPKYINIRRGSVLTTIVAVASCPWTYVSDAEVFIQVLSGWSVFVSPMSGVLASDYFLVRGQELHISDLYIGNSSSAYWYTLGLNWRAFLAWAMGTWPLIPGFVRRVRLTSDGNGWDHIHDLSYFYGFVTALVAYRLLYYVAPMERQTGYSPFVLEDERTPSPGSASSASSWEKESEKTGV